MLQIGSREGSSCHDVILEVEVKIDFKIIGFDPKPLYEKMFCAETFEILTSRMFNVFSFL